MLEEAFAFADSCNLGVGYRVFDDVDEEQIYEIYCKLEMLNTDEQCVPVYRRSSHPYYIYLALLTRRRLCTCLPRFLQYLLMTACIP